MKIYLVERTDNPSYGEYDSFVAAANSGDEARGMVPGNSKWSWTDNPEELTVTCIGEAYATEAKIIHASFRE